MQNTLVKGIFSMSGFDYFETGAIYYIEKTITENMLLQFANLTGDFNKVHMDDEYCISHGLKSRIVHGNLILSLLASVIGMEFPGEGSVIISQTADFLHPVRIKDTLAFHFRITGKNDQNALELNILNIKFKVINQNGTRVLKGEFKVAIK